MRIFKLQGDLKLHPCDPGFPCRAPVARTTEVKQQLHLILSKIECNSLLPDRWSTLRTLDWAETFATPSARHCFFWWRHKAPPRTTADAFMLITAVAVTSVGEEGRSHYVFCLFIIHLQEARHVHFCYGVGVVVVIICKKIVLLKEYRSRDL